MDSPLSSDGLIARLQEVFQDIEQYKKLVRLQGHGVQKVLDSFQQLLDIPKLDSGLRRRLIVATQKISNRSGLYPTCYDLKGVTIEGLYPISAGGFADIFKGDFEGQQVCLKAIKIYQNREIEHFLKQISKEAVLWCQLSHPNVLPIYGLFRFQNRPCFVSPWMSAGDINQYLRHNPQAARLPLMMDVAEGLLYLHKHGIIHGDLKGPNILVNDAGVAYVADFGLSSVSDPEIPAWTSHSAAASTGGTTRWQAPELFDVENDTSVKNTTASGVYAWSFICYEAFTGKIPLSQIERDAAVMLHVMRGGRPIRPADASPPWHDWGLNEITWSIMEKCWSADPMQRPTIEEVISLLKPQLILDNRLNTQKDIMSPMRFRTRMGGDIDMMAVDELNELLGGPPPLSVDDALVSIGTADLSENPTTAAHSDMGHLPLSELKKVMTSSNAESNASTPVQTLAQPVIPMPTLEDLEAPSGANWQRGLYPLWTLKSFDLGSDPLIPTPSESYVPSTASQPESSSSYSENYVNTTTRARKRWTGKGLLQETDSFMRDGRDTDVVIPVMGPVGAGKSTFIRALVGKTDFGEQSHTEQVEHFIIRHPRERLRRLVFVETPGFDDTYEDDSEILRRIAVWLAKSYSDGMKLAGVIYLHEISQPRMVGAARKNLEMLRGLCGTQAIKNVVLVTTKWNEVSPEVGGRREQQLKDKYWQHMLKLNSTMVRFEGTADSAWKIINHILDQRPADSLLIQRELVDLRRTLPETGAGRALRATLQELLVTQERTLARLQEQQKSGIGDERRLREIFEENQGKIEILFRQVEELKIPLTRRVVSFFT